ncbi:hypothetical protein [Archangium lansingense]|uniref:Uncharacterized protein n=1 Tax=Archangium lansingense TaxID=2995310 RepID=A0ABT4A6X0_9BACT|nr:hypothetical protein [Archangium lansinium]MCY1077405.1 hypothetical protein [Archangium lansinium]
METQTTGAERRRGSAPLSDDLRSALRAMVARLGENEARRRIGLSRGALARALAGLGVYPGSVALVRAALAEQQGQAPDSGARP